MTSRAALPISDQRTWLLRRTDGTKEELEMRGVVWPAAVALHGTNYFPAQK